MSTTAGNRSRLRERLTDWIAGLFCIFFAFGWWLFPAKSSEFDLSGAGCVVLAYHRVIPAPTVGLRTNPDDYTLYLDEFENQIRVLKADGVEFITPQQLDRILRRAVAAPQKCALVTLDDADTTQYQYAFPVLRREQVPFALFVITGHVGSDNFNGLQMASWTQIREMVASGLVTIGSHTHNQHARDGSGKPLFVRSEEMPRFVEDLQTSIATIERETGTRPDYFAYPYGFGTPQTDDVLLHSRMRLIFSLRPGIERPGDPSFFVKRVLVTSRAWESVAHWAGEMSASAERK